MTEIPQKRKWLKPLLGVALVGALAAGTMPLWLPAPQGPQFVTAKVARMDMEESVMASGTLEAVKQVSVGAQVSGQVKSLKVALGDKVTKGQLVAEIDSLTQQNDLHNAEAALENMRAQWLAKQATLKQADAAYQRQKRLRAQDAVSQESLQTAQATYEATKAEADALAAQIKEAEITVENAKINLAYTSITAPIDGTVVSIVTEEGQTVNAAQSAPTIIKLAQLDTMTIKAEISEADVTRVQPGQKVRFTILGEPGQPYAATLRAIEPGPTSYSTSSDSTSSTSSSSSSTSSSTAAIYYNGLFDAPNPDGKLRISMTAEVYIILNEAKNALAIPRTAIDGEVKGEATVAVLDAQGRPQTRQVKTGLNNNVHVQILSGLNEGETVVTGQASATAESSSPMRGGPPSMM